MYSSIAEPPSSAGACQAAVTDPAPAVAVTETGAPGTALGVPGAGAVAVPAPIAFTARTATSYSVPLTRPVIVSGLLSDPAGTQAPPSSRYSIAVSGEPPSAPSVNSSVSDRSPGATTRPVGASGSPRGATRRVALA